MEAVQMSPQQRDTSPSRIPRAQQQQDHAVAPVGDMDSRLAGKLSTNTAALSPSRIPRIAPPAATADKSLIPTARRKHHDVSDNHHHKRLQPATQQNSSGTPHSDKLLQQDKLPKVLQSQPGKLTQQRQHSDSLKPWDPQPELQQQSPQHPQQTSLQHQQQRPAGQPTRTPGQYQHQQQQGRFPVPRKFQVQEQQHTILPRIKHNQQQSPPRQPRPGHLPSQEPSALQHHAPATAANSGWLASRKMHEFLLSQQRRKEAYWLNKYGRVLGPTAPESLGKPSRNPASIFRHPAAQTTAAGNSNSSLSPASSHQMKLPAISSSYSKASLAAEDSAHLMLAARPAETADPSSGRSTARNSLHEDLPGGSSSTLAGWRQSHQATEQQLSSSNQQKQQQYDQTDDVAFEQIKAKITLASVPKLSVTTTLSKPVLPPAAAAVAGALSGRSTPRRQLPLRDLEAELQVLKAIKAREDALDKLRSCCARLGGAVGVEGAGNMLLPTDPLGRLFYRLVSNLRLKSLDVIEAHAAWQRKVSSPPELFTYRGKPYLPYMGDDLGFLDAAPWLVGRLLRCKAVEDCLLVELTPDGIPIDDVTSFDMRRGASHFSPEALRIRMARKVLAAAGVQPPPGTASSITAALQQQHHQQLVQEGSSSRLQHAGQPETGGATPPAQQVQPNAAVPAAAAALGILQRSSVDEDDEHDTVDDAVLKAYSQDVPTPQYTAQADNSSSSSSSSQVVSRAGSPVQQAPHQKEPLQQHRHQSQSLAIQQQQVQQPEPEIDQLMVQEQLDVQQQLNQQQLIQQQRQHRHTESVIDDLLDTCVTQLQDSMPVPEQQQQQHQGIASLVHDRLAGLEVDPEQDRHQAASQDEQQRQEAVRQHQVHRHTASVVDDLLRGLVNDVEQDGPQAASQDELAAQQGQQQHEHRHTASVVDDLLGGLVDDVEQARPQSAQCCPQQPQQPALKQAVMGTMQQPMGIASGHQHDADLVGGQGTVMRSEDKFGGALLGSQCVVERGSSDEVIDSILDSLVYDVMLHEAVSDVCVE